MPNDFVFGFATKEDFEEIHRIYKERHRTPQNWGITPSGNAAFNPHFSHKCKLVVMKNKTGQIAGFGELWYRTDHVELLRLGVLPEFRGTASNLFLKKLQEIPKEEYARAGRSLRYFVLDASDHSIKGITDEKKAQELRMRWFRLHGFESRPRGHMIKWLKRPKI